MKLSRVKKQVKKIMGLALRSMLDTKIPHAKMMPIWHDYVAMPAFPLRAAMPSLGGCLSQARRRSPKRMCARGLTTMPVKI